MIQNRLRKPQLFCVPKTHSGALRRKPNGHPIKAKVPFSGVRTSASFFGPLAGCGWRYRQVRFSAATPQGGKSIVPSGRGEAPTKPQGLVG